MEFRVWGAEFRGQCLGFTLEEIRRDPQRLVHKRSPSNQAARDPRTLVGPPILCEGHPAMVEWPDPQYESHGSHG